MSHYLMKLSSAKYECHCLPETRTLENLTNRLIMEQSRLGGYTTESDAFAAKRTQRYPKRSPGRCFKCNQEGHWKKKLPFYDEGE